MLLETDSRLFVRSARKEDFPSVFRLCELRFGEGYLTEETFSAWLSYPALFLIAEYDGAFAGFVFLQPELPEKTAAYMKLDSAEVIRAAGGRDREVIHCRSAALQPELEQHGIMHTLLTLALDAAKKRGIAVAYAPAWTYNGKIPMHRRMTALGFEKIAEKENLWYHEDGYRCIICGGRCTCKAVIYRKFL